MNHDIPIFSEITRLPAPREDGQPFRYYVDIISGVREYDDWTAATTYGKEATDPHGPRMIMHITVGEVASIGEIWDSWIPSDHALHYKPVAFLTGGTLYVREGYNPDEFTHTP